MSAPDAVLTATDVRCPGAGEVLEVITGAALVFALEPGGRRLPICTVPAGELLVGCDPQDDLTLLVTGLPGTHVRAGQPDLPADRPKLVAWAARLGAAAAVDRWPAALVNLESAGGMLAPGEHIAGTADVAWMRLSRGAVLLCGHPSAKVRPGLPLPLPRGTWVTTGLRASVAAMPEPPDGATWAAGLGTLAQLVLAAVADRRAAQDIGTATRLKQRAHRSDVAAVAAVDVLVAAVGGVEHIPAVSDDLRSAEFAAAAYVARKAGLPVDDELLTRVADAVETGRDPATAVAAACAGRVRSVTLAAKWWTSEGPPVLARYTDAGQRTSRPVALTYRRGWVMWEPALEQRSSGQAGSGEPGLSGAPDQQVATTRVVDAAVAAGIDRHARELLPVLPTRPTGMSDLLRLARTGSSREVAVVLLVTIALAGLSFLTPYLMGQLAGLFLATSPTRAYIGIFGALVFVVLAGTAWQAVRALALLRARAAASGLTANALWERVMRQPTRWHSQHKLGDRIAQASAINNASAAMPDEIVLRMLDVVTVLGSLAAIATINAQMLAWLGLLLGVQAGITLWQMRAGSARAKERVDSSAAASGRLIETLAAVNRLRVAGAESRAFLRWAQVQARFARADLELRRIIMFQGLVISVWPVLGLVVVVAVTASTSAGFGAFITAQSAAAAATAAISAMALSANSMVVARQSLVKAAPALASVPEGGGAGGHPGVLSGAIEARDLVFSYSPDSPVVLDHVSLAVRPGEHVAIVGPSGCGKTTLMRIMLGLEDPSSGVISVDGRDLAALDRPAVRSQIGSVLQSSALLPGTIRENVDMGRGLTAEQIWDALGAAAVAVDIRAMAMGLDTPVSEGGGTLSGGQRQRILIARALAGRPRLLILDEATSALDNLTQAAVVDALSVLRITRIVVAHRLSTIRTADRVVVMSKGRIVETGTYDELVARPGVFADLAARQQA